MKSRTHTLHKNTDRDGETDLFTALREHATEPAVQRVERVLTLFVTANTLAREQREQMRILERSGKDWRGPLRESLSESKRTWDQLNLALRRYPLLTLGWSVAGKFVISERAVTAFRGRWAPWERRQVGLLISLAKKPGELSRLRRCSECSQWFYANRSHQQFCGESCRRRHTAQDPEFKEKRARYMREVYRPIIEPAKDAREAGSVLSEKSKKGGR